MENIDNYRLFNQQFEFLPFTTYFRNKIGELVFSVPKQITDFSRYFISIKSLTIKISYGNIKVNLKIGVPKK